MRGHVIGYVYYDGRGYVIGYMYERGYVIGYVYERTCDCVCV